MNLTSLLRSIFRISPRWRGHSEAYGALDVSAPGGRYGLTPLFVSCYRRYYDVRRMLLRAEADPCALDSSEYTMAS